VFHIKKDPKDLLGNSFNQQIESYLHMKRATLRHNLNNIPHRFKPNKDYYLIRKWFIDNDIIIKQTDKNLGIAIISTLDYHQHVMDLLSNTQIYSTVTDINFIDAIIMTYSRLLDYIRSTRHLSRQEKDFLWEPLFNEIILPQFHIIPKIHKTPWIGRPIVSNLNWLTRNLAIYLNNYLEKYAQGIPTTLKDSKELIQMLDGKKVCSNTNFFSLDAIAMYTNIPLVRTFKAMRNAGNQSFPEHIIIGLEYCCTNNLFQYNDKVYKQLDGIPMGINFAVSFANISVFLIIESSRLLLPFRKHIIFWGRYIDDCNGLWNGSETQFKDFFTTMNSIDSSIQWTIGEFGKRVVYLDLYAQITDNIINFELYQKPQNKYLYLPFTSFHTLATKKGWIKGELIRICRNNSSNSTFIKNTYLFAERLKKRGYPEHFFIPIFRNFSYSSRKELLVMDKQSYENVLFSEMDKFFRKLMRTHHQDAVKKYGIRIEKEETKRLVFSTTFNSSVKHLKLKRTLNPVPSFNTYKKIEETQVTIALRIQNKLGSIFTHKLHNEKIKSLLG
jgi:hypothetical protein